MKECCVQLHASIQKWKQLTEEGFNVATKLVNTLQHEKYNYYKLMVVPTKIILCLTLISFYSLGTLVTLVVCPICVTSQFLNLRSLKNEKASTPILKMF